MADNPEDTKQQSEEDNQQTEYANIEVQSTQNMSSLSRENSVSDKQRSVSIGKNSDSAQSNSETKRQTIDRLQRTSSSKSKRTLSCKSAKFSRMLLNQGGVDTESQNELMKSILITQFDKYHTAYDSESDDEDNIFGFNSCENVGYPDEDDDADYDTDLEVDIEKWLDEEKKFVGSDFTGEKKYIASCETTGVVPATYFVRHIQENEVCMRFHGLGPMGTRAMCVPLKTNSKIEKLDLEGNDIEEYGCICLSDMLRENIYITKLVLSNNRIGNDGVISLCGILKRNDAVVTLDISGNELTDASAIHICEMLQKNSTIKNLLISHNQFEERGAECFYEALSQNEALESLDLSWNRFRFRGAVFIAEGVQENYGLRSLNLCMNGFGLDGASMMGKALKVNRTLQDIDLCFNRIPEKGVEDIAVGLQTNDTLQSLKIGSNQFGGDSAMFLLKSIDKNDSGALKYLEMLNVEVTEEFIELKKILEVERNLKIVHGGLVYDDTYDIPSSWRLDDVDSWMAKDPMSILKKYIASAGYRLIDFFKDFDKDGNMYITKDEFTRGLQSANISVTEAQIEELLQKLDKDKNGKIDYGELIEGDKEYRQAKRKILKQKLEESQAS